MYAVASTSVAPAVMATATRSNALTRARAPVGLPGFGLHATRLQRSREASTSAQAPRKFRLVARAFGGALGEDRGEEMGNDSFNMEGFSGRLEPMMAAGSQLGGKGAGALLEKKGLEQKQVVQSAAPKLADGGGGGGIGNFINFGGGGGGDDEDDDDMFGGGDEDGDGNEGNNWFRSATGELFDMGAILAVLAEWGYTVGALPMFFRASAELFFTGAFSSANMVRFLTKDNRPTIARWLYEHLPYEVSRGLVGRLMADPGLAPKIVMDVAITAAIHVYWEARQRGEKFAKELDLVAVNTGIAALVSGMMVYMLAPARIGAVARAPWQEMLSSLPNNVFEASSKTRAFSTQSRVLGFLAKAGQLSAVGAAAGGVMSLAGNAIVNMRRRSNPEFVPSVPVPELSRSVSGMCAYMGLSANLRYNLLAGMDRYLFERASVLGCAVVATSVARSASAYIGQSSRLWSQGLPTVLPPYMPGFVYIGNGKYRAVSARAKTAARAGAPVKKVRTVRKVKKVKKGTTTMRPAVQTA